MEIPQELSDFKEKVGSKLDSFNSMLTIISDKTSELVNATNQARGGIDSNYTSQNKTDVLSKMSTVSMILDTVNSSVNSDLKSIISKSQNLVNKIEELEKIKVEYDNYFYQSQKAENDQDKKTLSDTLAIYEEKFNRTKQEANDMLIELKSIDEAIEFIETFGSSSNIDKLEELNYGTFEKTSFKASNGVVVSYYIYVPDSSNSVEKLPIHMFLHGSGEVESGGGALNCSLPKMISDKEITPSGIVIVPQAIQGGEFYKVEYEAALVELINDTAEKYNGDLDRVSLSGYSNGAYAGYQFVGRYPDTFTAFIPISGETESFVLEKMKGSDTKFWIFHGKNDVRVDCASARRIAKQLESEGIDTQLYIYEEDGHKDIQNYTFNRVFTDEDGEEIYVLDWAMSQSRNNTKA